MADKKETTTKTGANDAVIEKAKDFIVGKEPSKALAVVPDSA